MTDIGEFVKNNHHNRTNRERERERESVAEPENSAPSSSDFVLQWGNRKRLRCMKLQVKNDSTTTDKTRVRISRGVVNKPTNKDTPTTATANFRRPQSPPPPSQPHHRFSRNSESMRGNHQSNGVVAAAASPDRRGGEEMVVHDKNNGNGVIVGGGASGSSETAGAQDSKKGGSSSGSDAIPVWLPKFVIALTNKEKEEDFMAIKGAKLPQRPKKRAKFIQRTLNLVSPGAWLCDLTLERYEVREKKISKKRPRGLKAMGNMNMDSDSE